MATESSGNFLVPVLVHVVAIAVGIYLGFVVMDKLAPDLPDDSAEPGVSAPAPGTVPVATDDGPRWYVQLDSNRGIAPPPWTYGGPLDGDPLGVGAGPPKPVRD